LILESWAIIVPVFMLLVLGIDVLLFCLTGVVSTVAVAQIMMYTVVFLQTGDFRAASDAATYASLLVAGAWILGFAIRYARGRSLPSMIPMPEYAKILLASAAILFIAVTDLTYFVYYIYYNVITFFVEPLLSLMGTTGSMFAVPIAAVIYSITSGYILRAIERMRDNVFISGALATVVISAVSLGTIGIAVKLLDQLFEVAEEYAIIAPFLSVALTLIAMFSLREFRRAFIELRPEAIVQIPLILSILREFIENVMPELYTAIGLLVSVVAFGMAIAAAVAGLGLGSRRVLIAGLGVNSALLYGIIAV